MKATIYHPSQHLNENEIYPIGDYCPLCNTKSYRNKSVSIQSNPDIVLMTCKHCKGSFASHLPSQEVLDSYYQNYYSNDNSESVTFHDTKKFAKHILKPMSFTNKREITILDFGGGGGEISYAMAQELMCQFPNTKVYVTVVDYEDSKDKVEGNLIFNSKRKLEDIDGKNYDIIIASAILEHIPNMYNTVTKLFSMVNNEGYFYARTPYMAPLMRFSANIDMTYPAHLYDLGGDYWNNVVGTYNLNAIKLYSRPSIVETGFDQSFFRALIAYILKVPGHLESRFFPNKEKIYWKWVGGWEIYLKFSS